MLKDVINTLKDYDILFVTAAGNETNDNDGIYKAYPCSFELDNLICVGSSNRYDQISWFRI